MYKNYFNNKKISHIKINGNFKLSLSSVRHLSRDLDKLLMALCTNVFRFRALGRASAKLYFDCYNKI